MSKNITRRHMLKFVGGSAAGVLLTPIPWKTLDDLAIWTQNGPWIPKPPRGEIQTRFTTCSLCPAGCGVRARCVAGRPISVSGVPSHPVSRGSLCPIGLGGHHLAYHPARLLQPVRIKRTGDDAEPVPLSTETALSAIVGVARDIKASKSAGKIAILDQVPGRTVSRLYRRFLEGIHCGIYLTGETDGPASEALGHMLPGTWGAPGFDLENTATLLSFGAPVLDGWGTPGRMAELAAARGANGERKLRIIQVEPRRSRTAASADLWLPIKPGTEVALALGIAHVLVRDTLVEEKAVAHATDFEQPRGGSYKDLIGKYTPESVSGITGLQAGRIVDLARELAHRSPAIAIGGGDPAGGPLGEEEERAICGLNLLLGSFGRKGGIVARREVEEDPALPADGLAPVSRIEDVPDGSIRLLITDSARSGDAIPWTLLEKKLVAENPLVVAISPVLAGDALRAHVVIPSPAYLEGLEEVPTPPHSPVSTFSVSAPLLSAPAGLVQPAQLVVRLASELSVPLAPGGQDCSLEACLRRKTEAIHRGGRGSVFSPHESKLSELKSVDSGESLWKLLGEGGCWIDSAPEFEPPTRYSLLGSGTKAYETLAAAADGRLHATADSESAYPLVLMPFGLRAALDDVNASPLTTKLYQESGLRRLQNQADINPDMARDLGLSDRGGAVVETAAGSVRVEIRFDPGVMPGVIHVAVGPSGAIGKIAGLRDRQSILKLCQSDAGAVWRVARAKVREA